MTRQRHSRSYHRYFENYAEKEILSEDGRYIIQRVYTGHYYRTDMTDEALIRQRRNILVLTILSEIGYLVGAILCGVSSVSIVAIATMPPLIAGILLAVSVFFKLTVPREMEIRSYRDSSENLISRSLTMTFCMIICIAATIGGCLLIPSYPLKDALPSIFLYFVSLLASVRILQIERNTPYLVLDPKHERPEESSPIRFEMQE